MDILALLGVSPSIGTLMDVFRNPTIHRRGTEDGLTTVINLIEAFIEGSRGNPGDPYDGQGGDFRLSADPGEGKHQRGCHAANCGMVDPWHGDHNGMDSPGQPGLVLHAERKFSVPTNPFK